MLAEENPELATRYGVRQAPTLIEDDAKDPVSYVGVSEIKTFLQNAANVG